MNKKFYLTCISFSLFTVFSLNGFSQDTAKMKSEVVHKSPQTSKQKTHKKNNMDSSTQKIYRPTRLGSSQKKYNTYKKNDKGAGAITTNPK